MSVLSHNIAAALAEWLGEAVPTGLSLRSDGSSIQVYYGGEALGGSQALEIIDDNDDRSLSKKIETATCTALDGIQDVIIEKILGPWPGQPARSADLPQPGCRVAGNELLVWFGDEAVPAVPIQPIRLR
jgi:hypothetical protein